MSNAGETEAGPKLVRGLGALDAAMIVVGSMIGSGIFILAGVPVYLAWSRLGHRRRADAPAEV